MGQSVYRGGFLRCELYEFAAHVLRRFLRLPSESFEVEAEQSDLLSDSSWQEYAHIAYFCQKANPKGMYLDSDSKSGLLADRDNRGGHWISKNWRPGSLL